MNKAYIVAAISAICIGLSAQPINAQDDYEADALRAKANMQKQMAPFMQDANKAQQNMQTQKSLYIKDALQAKYQVQNVVRKLQQQAALDMNKNNETKEYPQVLIFISFSMPDSVIKSYLRDAKEINAAIVIRGLINNSFKETAAKLQSLLHDSQGDGVQLNPLWFNTFNVNSVPSIVCIKDNVDCLQSNICNENEFDVVRGDVSLRYALETINNRGEVKANLTPMINKLAGRYA